MRKIFLLLIGVAGATLLMAQDLSEEPSEIDLPTVDEPSPPSVGTNEVATVSSATNQIVEGKLSFLAEIAEQYAAEGEYEEAERAYLRALDADPDNPKIQFQLSTLYILMERYAEAIPILEMLTSEFPKDPKTHNNLAWCYAIDPSGKNKKRAFWHAREALLLTPSFPPVWNTLAEIYYMSGEYEKALRSSKHAIDLLRRTNGSKSRIDSFQQQLIKIQRAERALKRFDGLDDEEF